MYLVTGATGNVGSQVVEQLLASGKQVRVFTRDAAKAARWGDRVQVVLGEFGKLDTFQQAIAGVEAAFIMNGALDASIFRQLIAAARQQGNPRIVFLSTLFAADPDSPIGRIHKDKEDVIRASGLHANFVRAGAFMSNSFQWLPTIKSEGIVYNPTGTGKVAPIAPSDIAAVVVKALTDPTLNQEILEVTGSELLTLPQQVSILAKHLGKPIQCVDIPAEAAAQNLIRNGIPEQVAAAVAQSFESIRAGRVTVIKDTVEQLTGHKPRTYDAWAQENAPRFA